MPDALKPPGAQELRPFLVNIPDGDRDIIVKVVLSVDFPTKDLLQDYEAHSVPLRDLIYRFIQGQGPDLQSNPEIKTVLSRTITDIINRILTRGPGR